MNGHAAIADKLVYAMRQLKGPDDIGRASEIMQQAVTNIADAVQADATERTELSRMDLHGAISMAEVCAILLPGQDGPESNQ